MHIYGRKYMIDSNLVEELGWGIYSFYSLNSAKGFGKTTIIHSTMMYFLKKMSHIIGVAP